VNVPISIDATGATDASAGLNTFIDTVPDGSIIVFPANGIFRMDHGMKFGGNATVPRHNLIFEGNGSTLNANGSGGITSDSPFALWNDNTDIIIRNFTIVGNNPSPGKYQGIGLEDQYGVLIFGGARIEIANCEIKNTWADGVGAQVTPSGSEPNGIWVHDSNIHDIGRMGISPTSSTGLGWLIERNAFTRVNWAVVDIEPNVDSIEDNHIIIRNNTVGPQPGINDHSPSFVSGYGLLAAYTHGDITIANNTATGAGMYIAFISTYRSYNVAVYGNTSDTSVSGTVMVFDHVDTLSVTNNHQPLSSGSLVSTTDCTSVTISGNGP
jgi:hypothetical protein